MDGLAQQMAGPMPGPSAGQPQGMPTIEEIIAMLMQGEDPEALAQMGIPPEMIMKAIEIIEQDMAAQSQGQPAPQGAPLPPQSNMGQEPGLAQAMGMG